MKIMISIFCCMAIPLFAGIKGVEGVCNATKLNVRIKPGTTYAKVATLKKGDKVKVLNFRNGWYEIAAPIDTKVYIASSFLKNETVIKSVKLRGGPSVAYSFFRIAQPGEKVTVLDTLHEGWTHIKPPANLTVWVSQKYIFLTPQQSAELFKQIQDSKKKPVVEEVKQIEAKSNINKQPEDIVEITDNKKSPLPFTSAKATNVEYEGFLLPLAKNTKYVTYAVAARINGDYFPKCYIHSDNINLKNYHNAEVIIKGTQRWVKGWKRPVVNITEIKRKW